MILLYKLLRFFSSKQNINVIFDSSVQPCNTRLCMLLFTMALILERVVTGSFRLWQTLPQTK